MHITKEQVPVKIDVPGATARQVDNFGDASRWGTLGAEYFSLGAGTDIAPLLRGLHDDACQAPHWGYMISGALVVTYWPPGHSVRVTHDAEVVLFSPQQEHTEVMDHMLKQMAAT